MIPTMGAGKSSIERDPAVFCSPHERRRINSEVMKNMTRGIVFLLVALATPVSFGGQPARGVAGVDVTLKQRPSERAVTDARGHFALEALPAGSYTLSFRARKAENLKTRGTTSDKVLVATAYSIKIEGAKRAVNKSGLTSDDLLEGYDIKVDLEAGARVRGQVAAGALKNMIWIPREPGSNIPGRWVQEGSPEARAAVHHNALQWSPEEMKAR
jgi:hypothetical protein